MTTKEPNIVAFALEGGVDHSNTIIPYAATRIVNRRPEIRIRPRSQSTTQRSQPGNAHAGHLPTTATNRNHEQEQNKMTACESIHSAISAEADAPKMAVQFDRLLHQHRDQPASVTMIIGLMAERAGYAESNINGKGYSFIAEFTDDSGINLQRLNCGGLEWHAN